MLNRTSACLAVVAASALVLHPGCDGNKGRTGAGTGGYGAGAAAGDARVAAPVETGRGQEGGGPAAR